MGGHGLWSTVPDYLEFLRMWLSDGGPSPASRSCGPRPSSWLLRTRSGT